MDATSLGLHAGLDGILIVQNRVIRRDQALAAGVNDSTIDSLVARGRWIRLLPRVYAVDADAADPERRIRAGWLWAGEDSVVTGFAAAWWWKLTSRDPGDIEIVVPVERRMTDRPGYRIIRSRLDRREIADHRRISLTTVAATCLRLARSGAPDLLDAALRRGLSQGELTSTLAAGAYRPGQPRARRSCADVAENPWSHSERALHRLFRSANLAGWTANSPLRVGGTVIHPDVRFDRAALVVEVDGRAFHSSPEQHDADHRRQNALVAAGWTVLRFTPRQIAETPAAVIALVRATLARLDERP